LTQNDERSYWGSIYEVIHKKRKENEENISSGIDAMDDIEEIKIIRKTLEIRGTVLFGWGLEPEPIGRFAMVEQTEMDLDDLDDEEDGEVDEDDPIFDSVFE